MNNTHKPFDFNHNVKIKLNKSELEELERQYHKLYDSLGEPKGRCQNIVTKLALSGTYGAYGAVTDKQERL